MLLSEIIAYSMDEAGEVVRDIVGVNKMTLFVLASIDYYNLQIQSSSKNPLGSKFDFEPTVQDGLVSAYAASSPGKNFRDARYVRKRLTAPESYQSWEIIDVVENIETLTELANRGKRGILFYGIPAKFQLSWTPTDSVTETFEIWSNRDPLAVSGLDAEPETAGKFHRMFGVRSAIKGLTELLLPPHGKSYVDFVSAKIAILKDELAVLEHYWFVHIANAADADNPSVANEYNIHEDYGISYY